jgi:predicted RNA-binding protein YlqC (UPF0109 family)
MSQPHATDAEVAAEALGLELAAWLLAVIAGDPAFPHAGLVTDPSAVRVEARWEEAGRLTLCVRVRPDQAGRVIGRAGIVSEQILAPLARRVGARLGLRVALEVAGA